MGLYPRGNDHRDQEGVEQSLAKWWLIGNSHSGIKHWKSWALGQECGGERSSLHFCSRNLTSPRDGKHHVRPFFAAASKLVFHLPLCVKNAVLTSSG